MSKTSRTEIKIDYILSIVNQLFDLAEVPVKKRQEINDKADIFVWEIISEIFKEAEVQAQNKIVLDFVDLLNEKMNYPKNNWIKTMAKSYLVKLKSRTTPIT